MAVTFLGTDYTARGSVQRWTMDDNSDRLELHLQAAPVDPRIDPLLSPDHMLGLEIEMIQRQSGDNVGSWWRYTLHPEPDITGDMWHTFARVRVNDLSPTASAELTKPATGVWIPNGPSIIVVHALGPIPWTEHT